MQIDWATLATIAAVAAAAAVSVVLLVAFAVLGLSTPTGRGVHDRADGGTHPVAGTALAVLSLLAAGLIVAYGLYLIIA